MRQIYYIERESKEEKIEKVYGDKALQLLYGEKGGAWLASRLLLPLIAYIPFISVVYGWMQKTVWSRRKIAPFIETYGIDALEFADSIESFGSFNDFFIRKLKPECRPIDSRKNTAVLPADGRYLVYPNLQDVKQFYIKGQKFLLAEFLDDPVLARRFTNGAMAIIRLCPTDYHRFHFPCDGVASQPKLIKGPLFSVNPVALKKRMSILWENKRMVTKIDSPEFGMVLFVEIGATSVGTIRQTFQPGALVRKGDEKGYFEFGGSCIVLLFEQGRIEFDEDLVAHSKRGIETKASFGESLGVGPVAKLPNLGEQSF